MCLVCLFFKGSYFSLEFVCKYILEDFYKKYCQTACEMVGFEITEEILTLGESVCSVVLTGAEHPQHPNRKDLERAVVTQWISNTSLYFPYEGLSRYHCYRDAQAVYVCR